MILDDFNARSSSWWKENKTTVECTRLEARTSLHNFNQLASEATHILFHSSSCIDIIFTNQPNVVVNCGTHSKLNVIIRLRITSLTSTQNILLHMIG